MKYSWIIGLFLFQNMLAQQDSLPEPFWEIEGELVEIKAQPNQQVFSVTSIPSLELERHIEPQVQTLINQVPGIWMESGALNTNRISIRGVGNREPFATSRLKVYLDEIPITDGLGETSMEDIDPSILSKIEIWKNASSSVWGAGLGGMIHLQTEKSWSPEYSGAVQLGSFGRRRTVHQLKSHFGSAEKSPFIANYNFTNQEGYRDNNIYRKHNAMWLQRLTLSDQWTAQLFGLYINLRSEIPSSLGITDFLTNPSKAADNWNQVEGYESYQKGLLGLSFRGLLSDELIWFQSYSLNGFDSYELRPFNTLEESRWSFTIRQRLSWQIDSKSHVQFGLEWFREKYDWNTFLEDNNQRDILTDQNEKHITLNAFMQLQHQFTDQLYAFTGVNLNSTNYDINSLQTIDILDYQYDPVLNPSVGVGYTILPEKLSIITSISRGFNPINIENALNSNGTLNPELKPESGWSFDLGLRWLSKSLNGSVTFYRMDVRNLLVRNRISEDVYESINAGKTLHQGIELDYRWAVADRVHFRGSYTLLDHRFIDYVNGDDDFSGNQLTGSPRIRAYHRLTIEPGKWSFRLHHWANGKTPIRDDQSLYGEGYQLINLEAQYNIPLNDQWDITLSSNVNNILNAQYASMFLINASSFGASEPRYYYPGLPRHWFADVRIKYSF